MAKCSPIWVRYRLEANKHVGATLAIITPTMLN